MRNKPATEKVVYHSKRPFLVVDLYRRPVKGTRTSRKGWGDEDSAWDISENPYVVDRLTTRHMQSASAILDIFAGSVVKNRFPNTTDADLFAHYTKTYSTKIQEALAVWYRREGRVPEMVAVAPPEPLHGEITVTI